MPLDPSISLQVAGGGGQGSPSEASPNPLATVGQFVGLQNQMNQLKQFQTQFVARQTAGQLIAAAPDMDSAQEAIKNSGQAAWLLPELTAMRELQKTQVGIAGELQTQNQSALQAVTKATVGAQNPQD